MLTGTSPVISHSENGIGTSQQQQSLERDGTSAGTSTIYGAPILMEIDTDYSSAATVAATAHKIAVEVDFSTSMMYEDHDHGDLFSASEIEAEELWAAAESDVHGDGTGTGTDNGIIETGDTAISDARQNSHQYQAENENEEEKEVGKEVEQVDARVMIAEEVEEGGVLFTATDPLHHPYHDQRTTAHALLDGSSNTNSNSRNPEIDLNSILTSTFVPEIPASISLPLSLPQGRSLSSSPSSSSSLSAHFQHHQVNNNMPYFSHVFNEHS
jgi:hypothetical protein